MNELVVLIFACLALNFLIVPIVGARVWRRRATHSPESLAPAMASADAYVSILFCRLAVQVARVIGSDSLCLLVRDDTDEYVTVAGRGRSEELIGHRVETAAVSRLVGAGVAVPARTPSGRDVLLHAPVRAGDRDMPTVRLLADLADVCATAVDDLGPHGRPDHAVRACGILLAVLDESSTGEERHPLTGLSALASGIGERLRLDAGAMIELMLGACVYGLAAVEEPDAPFAAELEEEDCLSLAHPVRAAERFASVPGLEVVTLTVRTIGERWDGRGRPYGLERERIPLASRILAACGAVNALVAAPPRGPGLTTEEALRRVQAASGSRFDPTVVAALSAELIGEVPQLGELVPSERWAQADALYSIAQ